MWSTVWRRRSIRGADFAWCVGGAAVLAPAVRLIPAAPTPPAPLSLGRCRLALLGSAARFISAICSHQQAAQCPRRCFAVAVRCCPLPTPVAVFTAPPHCAGGPSHPATAHRKAPTAPPSCGAKCPATAPRWLPWRHSVFTEWRRSAVARGGFAMAERGSKKSRNIRLFYRCCAAWGADWPLPTLSTNGGPATFANATFTGF